MSTPQKSLGQYFTPLPVALFAWEALRMFASTLDRPRAIDPACGAGVFLQAALKDASVQPLWTDSGLDRSGVHLLIHDGLRDYEPDIVAESFDVVIGNPPFHDTSLGETSSAVLRQLGQRLQLWRHGRSLRPTLTEPSGKLSGSELEKLKRFPSELLFLERFWELCKPQGWIAIILPEGVCANERWWFVREWLLENLTIFGIVGLPRHTFRVGGTTAKTCLLLMQKAPPEPDHRVLMAEVERVGDDSTDLPAVLEAWREGKESGSTTPWLPVPGRE